MARYFLLDPEQIEGPNKLNIFDIKGVKAEPTSFATLLGADNQDDSKWWDSNGKTIGGKRFSTRRSGPLNIGVRPAVRFSDIVSNSNVVVDNGDYKEVLYGEYPYSGRVDDRVFRDLQEGMGTKTGKTYTVSSTEHSGMNTSFELEEYEYQGKKYVFVPKPSIFPTANVIWNSTPLNGDGVWYPVGPVKWLVDVKNDVAVSENSLASGMTFAYAKDVFLDNFGKEIIPSKNMSKSGARIQGNSSVKRGSSTSNTNTTPNIGKSNSSSPIGKIKDSIIDSSMDNVEDNEIENESQVNSKMSERKENPYGFNFGEVSEEDIIEGMIESNVPVFLHGLPGDGKSARVKEYDPDCEIIYLGNETPEGLCGKSALDPNTSEMIDVKPTWLKKIEKKALEDPDRIHIVFFDELTNARPTVQGMAMNIILNKEVNGNWKLPDNVRIVAAGNELQDSLAANEMAEPVFGRFAHVYINTDSESLLAYGTSSGDVKGDRLKYKEKKERPTKFHPAVNAFLAYRGDDVVRTEYNGEVPNVDPRRWEFASDVLYEVGKPEMLRAIIGEELTKEFIDFVQSQRITLDDVLDDNYTDEDLEMDVAQKYATCIGLLSVDDKNVKKVLAFVEKLGPEVTAMFKQQWAHGNPERLEKLQAAEKKGLLDKLKGK